MKMLKINSNIKSPCISALCLICLSCTSSVKENTERAQSKPINSHLHAVSLHADKENNKVENVLVDEHEIDNSAESSSDSHKEEIALDNAQTLALKNSMNKITSYRENFDYLNYEYEAGETIYQYDKFYIPKGKSIGNLISFNKIEIDNMPKSIILKNITQTNIEKNENVKIKCLIATDIFEKDGKYFAKNIQINGISIHNKLLKFEMYTQSIKMQDIPIADNDAYPKNIEAINSQTNFHTNDSIKNLLIKIAKINSYNIEKVNSKFLPEKTEIKSIKIMANGKSLSQYISSELNKKNDPIIDYFSKDLVANINFSYDKKNDIGKMDAEIVLNNQAKVNFSINYLNYSNFMDNFQAIQKKYIADISEKKKLDNYSREILKLISINNISIDFKKLPLPIKELVKNDAFFKELFKESKKTSLLNFSFSYVKNDNNIVLFKLNSNIDRIYNIKCQSEISPNDDIPSTELKNLDCGFSGEKIFNLLYKQYANNMKTKVEDLQKIAVISLEPILNGFHIGYLKDEIHKFIIAPQSFKLSFSPEKSITLAEIEKKINERDEYLIQVLNPKFTANPKIIN